MISDIILSILILLVLLYFTVSRNDARDRIIEKGLATKEKYNMVVVAGTLVYLFITVFFMIKNTNNIFTHMVSVVSYIMIVGGFEDLTDLVANRFMLRAGYIINYLLLIWGITKEASADTRYFLILFGIIFLISYMIALLFFTNGIGPSDARMLLAVAPTLLYKFKDSDFIINRENIPMSLETIVFALLLIWFLYSLYKKQSPFTPIILIVMYVISSSYVFKTAVISQFWLLTFIIVYMEIFKKIKKDPNAKVPLAPAIMGITFLFLF